MSAVVGIFRLVFVSNKAGTLSLLSRTLHLLCSLPFSKVGKSYPICPMCYDDPPFGAKEEQRSCSKLPAGDGLCPILIPD